MAHPVQSPNDFASEPIATALMSKGSLDKEAFRRAYGDGLSPAEEDFALRFACSLTSQAASLIQASKNPSWDRKLNPSFATSIERFAIGALALNDAMFSFSLIFLKQSLAAAIPEWTQSAYGTPDLETPVKKNIAMIISENRDFTRGQRVVLIDTLSDAGQFISSSESMSKQFNMLARAKAEHLKSEIDAHAGPGQAGSQAPRI